MPSVIGLDTATDDTAVAAMRDGEVVFSCSVGPTDGGRPAHATRLLSELEEAAAAAGGWESVGRIAVGVGPGSFTGLRIGIATAKALAGALEAELAGVGTLAALARGVAPAAGQQRLAALDARRGELFAGLYDSGGTEIWEPFVAGPGELAKRIAQLPDPPLAVGSGALRFRDELQKSGAEIPSDSDPSHRIAAREVCEIGMLGAASDPERVAPIYLRPPDAERWRERDSGDN
jgi:tRNA threonylcarbamoyladenosine biosynthesis protein TsaB